jgi:hypothetical protein
MSFFAKKRTNPYFSPKPIIDEKIDSYSPKRHCDPLFAA